MIADLAFSSLGDLLTSPLLLVALLIGVPLGLFFGAVPGLGGKLGIVLAIPFLAGVDPMAGAVFLLSMHAVVHTGGSIPAILFGIPGSGADSAAVVDGYPMARNGEAGRALGASMCASGVGGVIGALFLVLFLPVLRPLMLSVGPSEVFFFAIFGITFIAVLSGDRLVKGLIVGCFGLMLSFVGADPVIGVNRFTFGQLFLWDGIHLITAMMAIFALPEMIWLATRGGSVSRLSMVDAGYNYRSILDGCVDVGRFWWLTLRTSIIGAIIGAIPGLGGNAASWICYGHAAQTSHTPEQFGQGAVEGVIAPDTANNSKEGGSLLPTLFFGIPGSSGMAMLLGAFAVMGIEPGLHMAGDGLGLVWTLIWALVVANIAAVILFLLTAKWVGMVSFIQGGYLIPFVFVFAFLGNYISAGGWEHVVLLGVFGLLGYALKRFDWPRAPFAIGLILGHMSELSLSKSLALWGPTFFMRPISLVLIALTIGSVGFYVLRRRRGAGRSFGD